MDRSRGLGVAVLVVILAVPIAAARQSERGDDCRSDPYVSVVRSQLASFTGWLERHDVPGYVGEVGWPDDRRGEAGRWNCLASAWYDDADAARLWVTSWDAEELRSDYLLSAYHSRSPGGSLAASNTQATVVEAHRSRRQAKRGVNLPDGVFGACHTEPVCDRFSNRRPGRFSADYRYGTSAGYRFLARRGVRLVRLGFRWERLQPDIFGPLDETALDELETALDAIEAADLQVVLVAGNFGGYYHADSADHPGVLSTIGSAELPVTAFLDLWTRLSLVFRGRGSVAAYDLMNEPALVGVTDWEQISQAAVMSIRATGDTKLVMVPGGRYSPAATWAEMHPRPWINDPVGNMRYEAHHYWDSDSSGRYDLTYEAECSARNGGNACHSGS